MMNCATMGCDGCPTEYFERGGVGSHYCAACYARIAQEGYRASDANELRAALAAAPQPAWNGPGETPHTYSPDYQAMGDCRICGHDWQAHQPAPAPTGAAPKQGETTDGR